MKSLYVKIAVLFLGLSILSSCPVPVTPVQETVTVRYKGNGGAGEPPPAEAYMPGEQFKAAQNSGLSKEAHYFSGWNAKSDGSGKSYVPGETYTMGGGDLDLYARWEQGRTTNFRTQSIETSGWYTVTAVSLAEGDHCIVYADQNKLISKTLAQEIVTKYEQEIYPPLEKVFGPPPDVDGNGKVILFLLDILDGYSPSTGGYVAGYFSSQHMMAKSVYPNSNEADMLFLDTYPGEAGTDTFYATIAHELQHLIDFGKTTSRDLWINEGLSLSAEYLYGGQRADRIDRYTNADKYPLTIPYGNNFFVWNGYWEQRQGDSLSNYITAYLFFQWLRLQAQGTPLGGPDGTGIYTAISDAKLGDYRAVTEVAAQVNPAFSSWPALLGSWMLANWYNSPQGLFGYRGEIDLNKKYVLNAIPEDHQYSLYPGEGVFSPRGSATAPSSGANIRYNGISSESASAAPEDEAVGSLFHDSPQPGQYLLTFNGNTNTNGSSEQGFLGSVSAEGLRPSEGILSLRSSGSVPPPPPGPYPIGLADRLAGHGGKLRPVSFEEARTKGAP